MKLGIGRRIALFLLVTWFPILILELIRTIATHQGLSVCSPLVNTGINVRLLFSGPLLIITEVFVEIRVGAVLPELEDRVIMEDQQGFRELKERVAGHISGPSGTMVELVLIAFVVAGAVLHFGGQYPWQFEGWSVACPSLVSLPAVWWNLLVSTPCLQFLQLRWVWRYLTWLRLLWGASRFRLNLCATHPDLSGGIGFVGFVQESFAPIWIALSAAAAGTIAFGVQFLQHQLESFYAPIAALVTTEALLLLIPMIFFSLQMINTKRVDLLGFGRFSSRYVQGFEDKWVNGRQKTDERLLGTSDIQSLSDIGGGFERARRMRIFPSDKPTILRIILAGLIPFFPLVFLAVPLDRIIRTMLKLVL